jgi:hypothetical protein
LLLISARLGFPDCKECHAIIYRPAREDELAAAQTLTAASINDLTQRHGFRAIATARTPEFQIFSLRDGRGAARQRTAGRIAGFGR